MPENLDKIGIDPLPQDKSSLTDLIQVTGKSTPDAANDLSNQYADYLNWPVEEDVDFPRGIVDENGRPIQSTNDDGSVDIPYAFRANRSFMNNFHLLHIKDIHGNNYPKTEEEQKTNGRPNDRYKVVTATDLIKHRGGANVYKPGDFLYCSRYGKIPMNRMITLRRFPYPVFDDIFSEKQVDPDIARMVTFMDETLNPMMEVVKFDYGFRWRELQAAAQTVSMNGSEDSSGWMQSIMKYLDPKNGLEAMQGENRLNFNPLHDSNRVYGPVDSIASTQIRDIGLDFRFSVNLTFDYTIRSINGLNSRAAFIDVISNALAVTMNNGKFWGGSRHWIGRRPSKLLASMKSMQATQFDEFLRGGMTDIRALVGKFSGSDGGSNAVNILRQIATNALNLNFGKVMDAIGRPSIPVFDSLLKGTPLGEWHLTVGNPLNPILTIGNLIVKNTSFQVDSESLSYDDFPTKIKITVTLEPQMPRDKAGIESMFNAGAGRTYWKPKNLFQRPYSRKSATELQNTSPYSPGPSEDWMFWGDMKPVEIKKSFKNIYDFSIEETNKVSKSVNSKSVKDVAPKRPGLTKGKVIVGESTGIKSLDEGGN